VKGQVLSDNGFKKISLSPDGDKTYIILTKSGTEQNGTRYRCSRHIGLSMMLEGDNGARAYTSYLEPKRGTFCAGVVDEFLQRNMPDLGKLKCLTVQNDLSTAWYFDFIAIRDEDGNTVKFFNESKKLLSRELKSRRSMKVCA
jgi:hypothetical protein